MDREPSLPQIESLLKTVKVIPKTPVGSSHDEWVGFWRSINSEIATVNPNAPVWNQNGDKASLAHRDPDGNYLGSFQVSEQTVGKGPDKIFYWASYSPKEGDTTQMERGQKLKLLRTGIGAWFDISDK